MNEWMLGSFPIFTFVTLFFEKKGAACRVTSIGNVSANFVIRSFVLLVMVIRNQILREMKVLAKLAGPAVAIVVKKRQLLLKSYFDSEARRYLSQAFVAHYQKNRKGWEKTFDKLLARLRKEIVSKSMTLEKVVDLVERESALQM
jgi:hypothetical protein